MAKEFGHAGKPRAGCIPFVTASWYTSGAYGHVLRGTRNLAGKRKENVHAPATFHSRNSRDAF